jgi:hypothetical protein
MTRSPDPQLPSFLVIGAMKAGTTSLHRYLSAHPDVFLPERKEIEFFSEPENWARGLDWYREHFRAGAGHVARGEASTGYTKLPRFPGTADRVAAVVPEVRLVYLVRDPVERMRSHYVHNVLRGTEQRPLEAALLSGEHYLPVSRYARQLAPYRERLGDDRILVVASEDLRDHRHAVVTRVLGFLGVDGPLPEGALDQEHHRSDDRSAVPAALRRLAGGPGGRALRRRLPAGVETVARRLSARRHGRPDPAATLDDSLRARLWSELDDDLGALEEMMGSLPSAWRR